MPSKPEKRLQREFERLQKQCPFPIIYVILMDNNIFHWKAMINASDHSPFEGGSYWLNIQFPQNYPVKPPIITFITQMYHPNIRENGEIDAWILTLGWSPVLTIGKVLLTIAAILNKPININNYLLCIKYNRSLHHRFRFNKDCVMLYTQNRLLYEEVANDCAVTNAGATRQYNLRDIFFAIRDLLFSGFGENSAFDIEAVIIGYTGLNIKKLNKWSRDLKLEHDNRYKRLLNKLNKPKFFDKAMIGINCVTWTGKTINCALWNDSLIKDIKQQIHIREGCPINELRLIFNGEILCDGDNIANSGIMNGSLVHVIFPYEAPPVGNNEGSLYEQLASYAGVHLPATRARYSRHDPMSC